MAAPDRNASGAEIAGSHREEGRGAPVRRARRRLALFGRAPAALKAARRSRQGRRHSAGTEAVTRPGPSVTGPQGSVTRLHGDVETRTSRVMFCLRGLLKWRGGPARTIFCGIPVVIAVFGPPHASAFFTCLVAFRLDVVKKKT